MADEEVKVLKGKVEYFFKDAKAIHITFKKGYWKNGYIREIGADFFIIHELVEGKMPVFFLEVKEITEFRDLEDKQKVGYDRGNN